MAHPGIETSCSPPWWRFPPVYTPRNRPGPEPLRPRPLGRGPEGVFCFPVDLVFIYLSITFFLPVLVLTRGSLLPPTVHSSTCHDPRSHGALPLLQGTLWSWSQEGQAAGKVHLAGGST